MATETTVRVARARYGGFVATFNWQGDWCRVFFDNAIELASELADWCVESETIETVLDVFEGFEWDDTYPLFQPAEAACYEPVDEPVHRATESRFWDWLAATIRVGAVAAPWVAIVILVRWAGGW